MAREKKTGKATVPPDGAAGKSKEKYSGTVKITPSFKADLEMVSDDFDMFPGQLIELHLSHFIQQEKLRVLEKRQQEVATQLEEARKKAKPK